MPCIETTPPLSLRFLGTAAAESYPAPFCHCSHCEQARLNGGRDIRRRSALLVNDDLLIDFGPDVFQSFQEFGLNATRLHTLCITHGHADHLFAENMQFRRPAFLNETSLPHLTVYGPQDALDEIMAVMAPHMSDARLSLMPVEAGNEWQSGQYSITALPAAHGGETHECLLYLIERAGKRFLYATDTGPLPEQAWQILEEKPPQLAIIDSTLGTGTGMSHMGIEQVKEVTARLRHIRGNDLQAIAHHFSHHNNPTYEELVRIYGADGIRVAYDGMTVEL